VIPAIVIAVLVVAVLALSIEAARATLSRLLPARDHRAGHQPWRMRGSMAKFELYQDAKRDYRWRLKGADGQVKAKGGPHATKPEAITEIEDVQDSVTDAEVVDLTGESGAGP
jgi:uncharacterized protein YegP (UPF0339 family)